jgi:hypothetical protein
MVMKLLALLFGVSLFAFFQFLLHNHNDDHGDDDAGRDVDTLNECQIHGEFVVYL